MKINKVVTGEKGLGMSYTTMEIGDRNWHKKIHEELIKELKACRK